jgi:hypothetical protein
VTTSREPLRAAREYIYWVPPLDVPAEDNLDVDDVLRHGAVKLFVARAQAVEPRYGPLRRLSKSPKIRGGASDSAAESRSQMAGTAEPGLCRNLLNP